MQFHAPDIAGLLAAADVRAGDLDVLECRRDAHAQFLHRRVGDVVTHQRAAADERFGERERVDDLRAHPGGDAFRRHAQLPFRRGLRRGGNEFVGQHAARAGDRRVIRQRHRRNFRQAVERFRFHRHARLGGNGDEARELRRVERMHARDGQRLRQFLETPRQFDAQRVSARRAVFQRHFQHAQAALVALDLLLNVVSAHALDAITVRQATFNVNTPARLIV